MPTGAPVFSQDREGVDPLKDFLLKHLTQFFPEMEVHLSTEDQDLGEESGLSYELLTDGNRILSYLQTLFFEERLIEVQIDDTTRIFFATLWDHPPEMEEKVVNDEAILVAPDYEEGSYLKEQQHIVLSPLEPVAGNIRIRSSNRLILRFYTGTTAVEMGTSFLRPDAIRGNQVLILEFPTVGRLIPNNRPFRAKIPKEYQIQATIGRPDHRHDKTSCNIMDLSAMGMALENDHLPQLFLIGDLVQITIQGETEEEDIIIHATVRHFARMRTKGGNLTICGVQFDLENRAVATVIEQLFAKMQRIFLRSLAERTQGQDINLTL
jgi:hypothetical protein